MENKKYFFHPEKKILKQGFLLEDEDNNVVCEAKMIKQSLLGAMVFDFVNHISNVHEEHKIGHTVTLEQNGNDMISFLSTKSYFKIDGKNIWDYLHEKGIRINTGLADRKIGMSYDVTFEGKKMATISMTSYNGKSIFAGNFCYDITTSEQNLDLAFLTAFAIARTNQVFYN